MKRSNRLLILVGMFLAVISMVGVILVAGSGNNGSGGQPKGSPTPTPEPQVPVVVAKTNIALGDKITADMVTTVSMPLSAANALGGETFQTTTQVIGKIAGGVISAGEVLYGDKSFLQPGTFIAGQDLAPAIASGMVGVSMEVDQVNGVGTLLVPGDHVDIVLSVWMDQVKISLGASASASPAPKWELDIPNPAHVTTKMVIQNRKVLATLLPPPETTAGAPASSPTPQAQPTAQEVTNGGTHMIVLVEVQPDEAEIIRWAQREETSGNQGYMTLSLALRSDKDNNAPSVSTPGITFKQLVSIYGVLPPDPRAIIPADLAKQLSW